MRRELLAWYDRNRRELPWRKTSDPYSIWVSEVMLQQTRVETVLSYYERFLARFPDAHALARASEDEVLASFSGLGYYRRARLLHRGVRELVERYGGAMPEDPAARRALPGVGRYTAGAIGSICFDREEAVVDGNVARVLSRVFSLEQEIGSAASTRALWEHADELVKGERPGSFNQALMELGARVCIPKAPRCEQCPIAAFCSAHRDGRHEELPRVRRRAEPKRVRLVAVVATRGERVALVRSEGSLFGGMYGPPIGKGRGREAVRRALVHAGITARLRARATGRIEHVLSHRVLDVQVWRASAADGEARLVTASELDTIGISKLTRRILELAAR